jgi:hypothetical protein
MVYAIVELPIVLLGVYVWLLPLLGRIENSEFRMQNYELQFLIPNFKLTS